MLTLETCQQFFLKNFVVGLQQIDIWRSVLDSNQWSPFLRTCLLSRKVPSTNSANAPCFIFYDNLHLLSTSFGGSGEIRTHGPLRIAGFQDRSHRPLDHASITWYPSPDSNREKLTLLLRELPLPIWPEGHISKHTSHRKSTMPQAKP